MSDLVDALLRLGAEYFLPWGLYGLALVAFIEAIFFPLPPDLLLIPLVLLDRVNALAYGLVTTSSSVIGGLVGYLVGLKGGRPLVSKIIGLRRMGGVERYFQRYGVLAVGIAALTPIPFKVFTIAAGVFHLRDLRGFVIASVAGRGGRFMTEATLLMIYGDLILETLRDLFDQLTILTASLVLILLAIHRIFRRARSRR